MCVSLIPRGIVEKHKLHNKGWEDDTIQYNFNIGSLMTRTASLISFMFYAVQTVSWYCNAFGSNSIKQEE